MEAVETKVAVQGPHDLRKSGVGVMWHSYFAPPSGYGLASRELVLALDGLRVDVRYAYIYGGDGQEPPCDDERVAPIRVRPKHLGFPQVVFAPGETFANNSGRYRIGYTMLEVDGVPADWVQLANLMDEVWVPSLFNVESFRSSGVKSPIWVMPLGIDQRVFNPQAKAYRTSAQFTFLSVFDWGERKAPNVLFRAFANEFAAHEDVLLLAKVTNRDASVNVHWEIERLKLPSGSAPICIMYNQQLPHRQLASLYRSADCFVLPTRGEGWCLPLLEAMACGLPAIATDWSAHRDFMNDDNAYPLRVKRLIPAKARCPYYDGFGWADPDEEHLRFLMRYVYEHREEANIKGLRAAAEVATRWTWEQAARRMVERIEQIASVSK
ncbi:MAG: glycosyltransferase [Chloroflexi bacterium]|nr:glycosyltransferase [Chloroflexota bacterium]